ncbi:hypothetical protein C8R46DRAFT_1223162 [Mycena filopes]|nr:hypothetical protein C8R46DRAFT_1223162 [Mycena filopes]
MILGALFVSVRQNVFTNKLASGLVSSVPGVNPAIVLSAGATSLRNTVDPQYHPPCESSARLGPCCSPRTFTSPLRTQLPRPFTSRILRHFTRLAIRRAGSPRPSAMPFHLAPLLRLSRLLQPSGLRVCCAQATHATAIRHSCSLQPPTLHIPHLLCASTTTCRLQCPLRAFDMCLHLVLPSRGFVSRFCLTGLLHAFTAQVRHGCLPRASTSHVQRTQSPRRSAARVPRPNHLRDLPRKSAAPNSHVEMLYPSTLHSVMIRVFPNPFINFTHEPPDLDQSPETDKTPE